MFSMDDLSTKLNISKQSLYKLINNNQELSTLINDHSRKEKRKIFYDEAVLEWLCKHYGIDSNAILKKGVLNSVVGGNSREESEVILNDAPSPSAARIKELEAKIEDLEAKLQTVQEEKQRLFQENGALLLTVSQMSNTISQMTNHAFQEFQASVKMLPAPRKPLLERIKAVFTSKGKQPEEPTKEASGSADR